MFNSCILSIYSSTLFQNNSIFLYSYTTIKYSNFFLYPILDFRVKEILLGNRVEDSMTHLLFIFSEIIKLKGLIISRIVLFKS